MSERLKKGVHIQLKRKLKPADLSAVYRKMRHAAGHQSWWPGDSPFEIIVGAILTQNTAWTNVEKAIVRLKQAKLLTPQAMLKASRQVLARAIQPSGFFNIKTKRLKNFLAFFDRLYDCDIDRMKRVKAAVLREQLLAVNGIGPETADSILLYALDKKSFVIDAYTKRIFSRHGLMDGGRPYNAWRDLFMENLPARLDLYNDFHAQIVYVAKHYCRAGTIVCHACPLKTYLKTS